MSDPVQSSDEIVQVNEALYTAISDYLTSVGMTDVVISFELPDTDSLPSTPTISVFLYEIHEDLQLRMGQPRNISGTSANSPATISPGWVNVNCNYLITYWDSSAPSVDEGNPGGDPDNQATKVMGAVVHALINNRQLKTLPNAYVRMIPPKDELNSLGNFWQSLGNRPRLSLHASATVPVWLADKSDTVAVVKTAIATLTPPLPVLDSALSQGLLHFFSFDSNLRDAITSFSSLQRFDSASTTTEALVADNFGRKAMQVSSLNNAKNALNGMKLADDFSSSKQFSIGFWLNSDDSQNNAPVISNKQGISGLNPGFVIEQHNNGAFKFNVADGKKRADTSLLFTKSNWIYVAMTFDVDAKAMCVYVADPVLGVQTGSLALTDMDTTKLSGLYSTVSFNEDATGTYYSVNQSMFGTMTFNDVAVWNRVITQQEVSSLFDSKCSLSTLLG